MPLLWMYRSRGGSSNRFGRNAQHPIVKHIKNIDARQAASRMAGAGVKNETEQVAAILDRFQRQFVVGHRRLMFVGVPTKVFAERLGQHTGGIRASHDHMMLESVLANVTKQTLQLGHVSDGACAKGVQLVVGQFTFANVRPDAAVGVCRRNAAVGQRPCWRAAFQGAVRILHAQRACQGLARWRS